MNATWTPERKAKIAGWLKEGLSAGEIVGRLDVKVSRNAVIGIVTRDAGLKAIGFVRSRGNVGRRTIPNKPIKNSRLVPPAAKPEPLPVSSGAPRPCLSDARPACEAIERRLHQVVPVLSSSASPCP